MKECPKCGKQHEGEGLPPSLRDRIKICNACFRINEKIRHKRGWKPKSIDLSKDSMDLDQRLNAGRLTVPCSCPTCVNDEARTKYIRGLILGKQPYRSVEDFYEDKR